MSHRKQKETENYDNLMNFKHFDYSLVFLP